MLWIKFTRMKVVIIGSGIAGMCCYIGLKEAGFDVKVYDRDAKHFTAGFLTLWPNAVKAFRVLGVADEILAQACIKNASLIQNHKAKPIVEVPIYRIGEKGGIPIHSISREALNNVLRSHVDESDFVTHKCLESFEQVENKVHVRFEDGEQVMTDMLIGADGAGSTVRRLLQMPNEIRYAGRFSWNGTCDNPTNQFEENRIYEVQGRGKRVGFTRLPGNRIGWYANLNLESNFQLPQDSIAFLEEQFNGWPMDCDAFFARTKPEEIKVSRIQDKDPLTSWSKGHVVLTGDAAHPMTPDAGQGACQSVEDAAVLAIAAKNQHSIRDLISHYEKERIPRTTHIINYARKIGTFSNWSNPFSVKLREWMFKMIPEERLTAGFEEITNIDF